MPPKPKLHRGDVVLAPFPFADLRAQKVKPAIVISADPQGAEMIFAFVTSVLTNHSPCGAEVVLMASNSEFRLSGLKADSLIRLDKVVTLSRSIVSRQLGQLGPKTLLKMTEMLRRALDL